MSTTPIFFYGLFGPRVLDEGSLTDEELADEVADMAYGYLTCGEG